MCVYIYIYIYIYKHVKCAVGHTIGGTNGILAMCYRITLI